MTRKHQETTTRPNDAVMISPSTRRLAKHAILFLIGVVVFGLVVAAAAIAVRHHSVDRSSHVELRWTP
ncbi:MAG: hypothetical protein HOP09_12555 [Hyphomicrobium sp.]|nr:hypothetical protein [Hyphomicrobium sp.]